MKTLEEREEELNEIRADQCILIFLWEKKSGRKWVSKPRPTQEEIYARIEKDFKKYETNQLLVESSIQ